MLGCVLSELALSIFGLTVTLIGHMATTIWWASRLTNRVRTMEENLREQRLSKIPERLASVEVKEERNSAILITIQESTLQMKESVARIEGYLIREQRKRNDKP